MAGVSKADLPAMRAGDGGGSLPSFWGTADHRAGRGPLPPVTGDLLLTIAEQRLKSASTEDYPEAKRRLDFIVRNAGDRLYDIKCPRRSLHAQDGTRDNQGDPPGGG